MKIYSKTLDRRRFSTIRSHHYQGKYVYSWLVGWRFSRCILSRKSSEIFPWSKSFLEVIQFRSLLPIFWLPVPIVENVIPSVLTMPPHTLSTQKIIRYTLKMCLVHSFGAHSIEDTSVFGWPDRIIKFGDFWPPFRIDRRCCRFPNFCFTLQPDNTVVRNIYEDGEKGSTQRLYG